MKVHSVVTAFAVAVLGCGVAYGDIVAPHPAPAKTSAKTAQKPATKPTPTAPAPADARDAVAVARKAPAVAEKLKQASAGNDETVTQVPLGGQCGFAGCSSETLVAFTYRSKGANTTTQTVLALVSCTPIPTSPCSAVPAEVHGTAPANPAK